MKQRIAQASARRIGAIGVLLCLVLVASCGDGGESENEQTSQAATKVSLEAVDNAFQPTELNVPPGARVTVDVVNSGKEGHTFTIRDLEVDTGLIDPGESASVTFTAPDQPTQFICVPHEFQGMTGELVPE